MELTMGEIVISQDSQLCPSWCPEGAERQKGPHDEGPPRTNDLHLEQWQDRRCIVDRARRYRRSSDAEAGSTRTPRPRKQQPPRGCRLWRILRIGDDTHRRRAGREDLLRHGAHTRLLWCHCQ